MVDFRSAGVLLLIAGFGAFRTLAAEEGLHVLELDDEKAGVRRVSARVRIAPGPPGTSAAPRYEALKSSFHETAPPTHIVRRYRMGAAALVRDARTGWRSGRVDEIMAGNFDLYALSAAAEASA